MIDLNPTSDIRLIEASHTPPSGEASSSTNNSNLSKSPLDISLLLTQTYHEYDRNPDNIGLLSQDPNISRSRERSSSPSRNRMVDKGSEAEGKKLTLCVDETLQEAQANVGGHEK